MSSDITVSLSATSAAPAAAGSPPGQGESRHDDEQAHTFEEVRDKLLGKLLDGLKRSLLDLKVRFLHVEGRPNERPDLIW
jgi:hypothetical protein